MEKDRDGALAATIFFSFPDYGAASRFPRIIRASGFPANASYEADKPHAIGDPVSFSDDNTSIC